MSPLDRPHTTDARIDAAAEDDERRLAIWQLQQTLGPGLITEVAESEPVLVVAGNPKEGTRALTVRCDPREGDGDRLWFWLIDPEPDWPEEYGPRPLMEADRLADAVVRICGERKIRGQHG
jgi:hypothetical protein